MHSTGKGYDMFDENSRYSALMGLGPSRIPHWENLSNPNAETYITGIDYYQHPRLCRLKMNEIYPQLDLPIPENDDAIATSSGNEEGIDGNGEKGVTRWGSGVTATWIHGEAIFKSVEDVFSFSPLEKTDFSNWPHVVVNWDYSSEQVIYERLRPNYPIEWGNQAPKGSTASADFYNTMFMWPLLTFGWELFMEACLYPEFERVMLEFAEINRRVFRAMSRLPVNFVFCHDDIATSRGPVCSPSWMHKYIFPRYEEYWSILKSAGKEVIFVVDGCADAFVDDVMKCGARGIIGEPYTDYKMIARKFKDCVLAGEGDNRILMTNDRKQIHSMVSSMVETGKMTKGYMMGIGNHIPWNIPPEAVQYYLDLSAELARR